MHHYSITHYETFQTRGQSLPDTFWEGFCVVEKLGLRAYWESQIREQMSGPEIS